MNERLAEQRKGQAEGMGHPARKPGRLLCSCKRSIRVAEWPEVPRSGTPRYGGLIRIADSEGQPAME